MLHGACACCYYRGAAELCSLTLPTGTGSVSASSAPHRPTVASPPSGPPGSSGRPTLPADPILVAYQRSLPATKRQLMNVRLWESEAFLNEELGALRYAEQEIDDDNPVPRTSADPILVASYRSLSKAKQAETRAHLQGALARVESQLAALAAAQDKH
ncbi:hypothetical protein F5Y06DRAFT_52114 [Hypoxylon sp. FL0890]|nr:hypothetical protein F5Y06DRAFT_52114 [Hypoxylon sp. FL0890]